MTQEETIEETNTNPNHDPYSVEKFKKELKRILDNEMETEIRSKNNIVNLEKIINALEKIE